MYRKRFPDRSQLDRRTIVRLRRKLCTSGSFYASKRNSSTLNYRKIGAVESRILNAVEDNLFINSRAVGSALAVSHVTISKSLLEDRMYTYHFQRTEAMTAAISFRQLNIAHRYLQQTAAI